jgi:uncharacterized protein (TIGR00730 family)
VCVYAGSNTGLGSVYRRAAIELARVLVKRQLRVVYGGASIGLMGLLADTILEAGGEVIGIIPQALVDREVAHSGLSELRVVGSMHERKSLMSELSDTALALPGGLGTLEELLEMATWSQLGIHSKPCGLLNAGGYYDPLTALLDHAVAQSFLSPEHRGIVLIENDAETLLQRLDDWSAPPPKRRSG